MLSSRLNDYEISNTGTCRLTLMISREPSFRLDMMEDQVRQADRVLGEGSVTEPPAHMRNDLLRLKPKSSLWKAKWMNDAAKFKQVVS